MKTTQWHTDCNDGKQTNNKHRWLMRTYRTDIYIYIYEQLFFVCFVVVFSIPNFYDVVIIIKIINKPNVQSECWVWKRNKKQNMKGENVSFEHNWRKQCLFKFHVYKFKNSNEKHINACENLFIFNWRKSFQPRNICIFHTQMMLLASTRIGEQNAFATLFTSSITQHIVVDQESSIGHSIIIIVGQAALHNRFAVCPFVSDSF